MELKVAERNTFLLTNNFLKKNSKSKKTLENNFNPKKSYFHHKFYKISMITQ